MPALMGPRMQAPPLIMLLGRYDLGCVWQTLLTCSQFIKDAAKSDPSHPVLRG